ncbi:saccharopine dehydrogenase family protein [Rhodococcus qingshengii]|uniref:saccharopine dehydrogenase family protein n=1 Tax=Rhodococcus qingshengii TaxID=334542 RepID=UPI0015D4BCC2|nr:saccharopine dehydrogenase NADP-binding domain-containing protein [Rhodococcus qingshengii]
MVLGAAGEVGAWISRDLAECADIGSLLLLDVDKKRLDALVEELHGGHVEGRVVDLADRAAVLDALSDADLLMNCTSLTLFDKVIDLALAAGVNYADLISEPTEAQRRAAAEAGITAVSGLGSSPGLSNVLVSHAHREFTTVEEVHIQGVTWRAIAPSPGLLDTVLWELADDTATRQYFQNGRYHWAASMDGSRVAEFPEPVGKQHVYFVSHTEPRTLPKHFPELKFCAMRVTWPVELMNDIRVLNKYGLLDSVELPGMGGATAIDATRARIWQKWGGIRTDPCLLFTQVEILGTQDGRTVRRIYNLTHSLEWGDTATGRQTGICAAVGAQLLAKHGSGPRRGFVDPEVYYDPAEFIAQLQKRGTLELTWSDTEVSVEAVEREANPAR